MAFKNQSPVLTQIKRLFGMYSLKWTMCNKWWKWSKFTNSGLILLLNQRRSWNIRCNTLILFFLSFFFSFAEFVETRSKRQRERATVTSYSQCSVKRSVISWSVQSLMQYTSHSLLQISLFCIVWCRPETMINCVRLSKNTYHSSTTEGKNCKKWYCA